MKTPPPTPAQRAAERLARLAEYRAIRIARLQSLAEYRAIRIARLRSLAERDGPDSIWPELLALEAAS